MLDHGLNTVHGGARMVPERSAADTLASNKALVRRLYEEGFNDGNLDIVAQLVSPEVVTHNPIILDAPTGPDSIRGGIVMLRRAFPDLRVEVLDLIAEGDRVAAFLLFSGTNSGDYRRGGATNRHGSMRAFFIWRVAEGRLVECWGVADRFALLQQLGIIPSDDELAAKMPELEGAD
jgi:predicted ester cyclase